LKEKEPQDIFQFPPGMRHGTPLIIFEPEEFEVDHSQHQSAQHTGTGDR
jgi:hypothetical protein